MNFSKKIGSAFQSCFQSVSTVHKQLTAFRRWRTEVYRRMGEMILDTPPRKSEAALPLRLSRAGSHALFAFNGGKIGDCICSTFVFRELKRVYPELNIHILCSRNVAPIFIHDKNISHVWDMRHSYRILELVFSGIKLRKFKFDLVVIRDGDRARTRELLFYKIIRGVNYFGYSARPYKFLSRNLLNTAGKNIREIKGEILRYAGIDTFCDEYSIPRDANVCAEIENFLQKENLARGKFIALNLFGNNKRRKISTPQALALIEKMWREREKTGKKILLLSSPKDDATVGEILEKFNRPEFLKALRPTKNIFQNIELVRASAGVISPDTSIVHIADGLRKPMIAFFSPREVSLWGPHSRANIRVFFYRDDVDEIDFHSLPTEQLFAPQTM